MVFRRLSPLLLLAILACQTEPLAPIGHVSPTQPDGSPPPSVDGGAGVADAGLGMEPASDGLVSDAPIDAFGSGADARSVDARAPDGAGDGPPDVGKADPDSIAGCPGPDCPVALDSQHVQLWLKGDDPEIACEFVDSVAGRDLRVSIWPDRSGRGNDARAPVGGIGPLCGPSAGKINGIQSVRFPRSQGLKASEHLEFDLTPLENRPFTIAVVEHRAELRQFNLYFLGSELADNSGDCEANIDNPNRWRTLQLGYHAYYNRRARTWGPNCGVDVDGPAFPIPDRVPTIWLVVLDESGRLTLRTTDGINAVADNEGIRPAPDGTGTKLKGYIGRRSQDRPAVGRYFGQLGEIVIFDIALSQSKQSALLSHLKARWKVE